MIKVGVFFKIKHFFVTVLTVSDDSEVDSGNILLESLELVTHTTYDLVQYVGHWPGNVSIAPPGGIWCPDMVTASIYIQKKIQIQRHLFYQKCIYLIAYHTYTTCCKQTTLLTRCTMIINDKRRLKLTLNSFEVHCKKLLIRRLNLSQSLFKVKGRNVSDFTGTGGVPACAKYS